MLGSINQDYLDENHAISSLFKWTDSLKWDTKVLPAGRIFIYLLEAEGNTAPDVYGGTVVLGKVQLQGDWGGAGHTLADVTQYVGQWTQLGQRLLQEGKHHQSCNLLDISPPSRVLNNT